MGRQIRRVPLDFRWPLNKTWPGFLNPYSSWSCDCPCCEGTGSSKAALEIKALWSGDAPFSPEQTGSKPFEPSELIAGKRLENMRSHGATGKEILLEAIRLCKIYNNALQYHLSESDVEALYKDGRVSSLDQFKVNRESIRGFGRDCLDRHIVTRARCEAAGKPWKCQNCDGEGYVWATPEKKTLCENWEREEPPQGPGWQMWETVSEGSPISPPFQEPEALAEYMARSSYHRSRSKESWLSMILGEGWEPSFIMVRAGTDN